MDDKIQSLMIRNTWDIVPRKSAYDKIVLPGTCPFKGKRKPDWTVINFMEHYFVRWYSQKRLSP